MRMSTSPESAHPSPQRRRVGGAAVAFGLCAAPLGWSAQLVVTTSAAAHACFAQDVPLLLPLWPSLHRIVLAVDLVALVLCLLAGVVAWRVWHKTRDERPGSGHHVLESGDGRTRFMAMAGMMTSGLFFVAVALSTLNATALAACGR